MAGSDHDERLFKQSAGIRARGAYIPALVPDSDLRMYDKAGMGNRIGFGLAPTVLVVDATRAFVEDEFPLGSSRMGEPAVRAIRSLCDVARSRSVQVIYTRMEKFRTPREAGRWFEATPRILSDTETYAEGGEFPSLIQPQPEDLIITKPKPSAFFGTQLQSILTSLGTDTLIVAGMVTSGCVRATVDDAFARNYRVVVPVECVADRAEIPHQVNLFDMDMLSADVLPLERVVDYLQTWESEQTAVPKGSRSSTASATGLSL